MWRRARIMSWNETRADVDLKIAVFEDHGNLNDKVTSLSSGLSFLCGRLKSSGWFLCRPNKFTATSQKIGSHVIVKMHGRVSFSSLHYHIKSCSVQHFSCRRRKKVYRNMERWILSRTYFHCPRTIQYAFISSYKSQSVWITLDF